MYKFYIPSMQTLYFSMYGDYSDAGLGGTGPVVQFLG